MVPHDFPENSRHVFKTCRTHKNTTREEAMRWGGSPSHGVAALPLPHKKHHGRRSNAVGGQPLSRLSGASSVHTTSTGGGGWVIRSTHQFRGNRETDPSVDPPFRTSATSLGSGAPWVTNPSGEKGQEPTPKKTKNTGSWGFWVAPTMKNGRDPPQIRVDIGKKRKKKKERKLS